MIEKTCTQQTYIQSLENRIDVLEKYNDADAKVAGLTTVVLMIMLMFYFMFFSK
jgi:hypothetical protein